MNIILRNDSPIVTWEQLVELEPRLLTVATIREAGKLVGWFANRSNPILRSSDAYHIVIDRLLFQPASGKVRTPVLLPQPAWIGISCLEASK